ncbi:carbohydrate ABC transporter permease [Actinoplanes regularis]|uniref:N-acetylglucosamine transport system permease protein n=1 Tax=Actinoplanes regularis TaxID=52697 RepID=A0A238WAT5_9ACTN|nr:carbohydrate ABC transporter permease [Actinoplanes regularis]GIE85107.1 sugar ABC transporter permease [Actinoplanes regularis]GLW27295.1 sugar ABC transporter permease [Actinoplanes regularis]SNR43394.1 N-acetylglucosamine transport system permease protein [Actinoplanes regularis]
MTNLVTDPPAVATKPAPVATRERRVNPLNGMAHIALLLWALATAGPLIWVLLASFKSNSEIFLGKPFALPEHFSFKTYTDAWSEAHIGQYFLNSVFVVAISTAGTMLLGSMAAYVLARYKFPGNRAIYYLFVSGLAFPTFMALAPIFGIVKSMGLLNTFTGLILVYIAYSLSFTVFFLVAFFRTLPAEIDEAALVDGAGHLRRFFQIMMPMAKSGLISITIFNIVGQWNQYLLPVVIMQGAGSDANWVLTQGIANISVSAGYHAEWSTLFAALTLSILPMIVVYGIFQRQIQAGLTAGAVK